MILGPGLHSGFSSGGGDESRGLCGSLGYIGEVGGGD